MSSTLLDVLQHLPQSISSRQRLFVDHTGNIRVDQSPWMVRPLFQFWSGRYCRRALIQRLYDLSTELFHFERAARRRVVPSIPSYRRSGTVLASVDVCLCHIGIVLASMETLLSLIAHMVQHYAVDLVLLQTNICTTTQKLTELQLEYRHRHGR